MKLLPNEEKIVTSNGDKIILTDHRIQMTDRLWGQSYTISIFLEDISSIEIKYRSRILLLVLGVASVLAGFFLAGQHRMNDEMISGLILGAIFFVIWWFTRKHIISISSNGGAKLHFIVQGMSDEKVNDFVYKLSVAKQTRVNQLSNNSHLKISS
jgi:hypothetical protein